jgi:RNA polymerase sigma factor (sigma-70 family)
VMAVLTPSVLASFRLMVYSITGNDGAVDPMIADSISKCAERAHRVSPGKIVAYIRAVLRNKAFDWNRRAKRRERYLEFVHDEAPTRAAFAEAISREALEYFDAVIKKLPRAIRRVVILRVIEKLSYDEIAKKMKITQTAARTRFFRAKQALWEWVSYMKA